MVVVFFWLAELNLVLNVYFSLASCLYTLDYLSLASCLNTVVSSLCKFQGRCCQNFPLCLHLFIHNNLGEVFLVTSIVFGEMDSYTHGLSDPKPKLFLLFHDFTLAVILKGTSPRPRPN